MTRQAQDEFRVSEEAALWLHRLTNEDSPEHRAGFDRWIRQGAGNLEEFLFAQTVWKQLDHLGEYHRARLPAVDGNPVLGFPARDIPAPAAAAQPRRRAPDKHRRWLFAAAAGLATVTGAWWWMQQGSVFGLERKLYATEVGSQETVKLTDGSMVHLNTRSEVEVRYSGARRVVHLKAGEALFSVAKDISRPFVVKTGDASIRALGTAFNVYRASDAIRVAITEGAVQITHDKGGAPLQLKAGESAEIRDTAIVKTPQPDVERATAWRSRRLVFPGNRVADIAAEFNRYNTVQIEVEGAALQDHLMSGVFDADNPDPWLDFLARNRDVTVDRKPDAIVIR